MKRKKLLLVSLVTIAVIGVAVATTLLLTWDRLINFNIPERRGFDVYATTLSAGTWIKGDELPAGGNVNVTDVSYVEDYWIQDMGNVPAQVNINPSLNGYFSTITATLTVEYDSNSTSGNPSGLFWQNQPGQWNTGFNLQLNQYVVIELSITGIQVGQSGSMSLRFLAN
jgi:hypothetical protein